MKDLPLDPTELNWLSSLARALLGEAHAADDLVQETAVAVLEGPIPLNAPRRAWLASVARNLAARRFRGEARRSQREERVARPEALPDSVELVEKAEIAEQVTAAARRLAEPYRRTILLRFLEGRSPEEIARLEGKPADTVRWRIRRGLELLREELVQRHDRQWSSWCVLLLPLARSNGSAGLATAGVSGGASGTVASLAAMKATLAVVVMLGCAGLWLAWEMGDEEPASTSVTAAAPDPEVTRANAEPELVAALAPAGAEAGRAAASPAVSKGPEPGAASFTPNGLGGQVVDEDGAAVPGATVYLIPSREGDERNAPVRARTESDEQGGFLLSPEAWRSDDAQDEGGLELGVAANGYLRASIPDVLRDGPSEDLVVVLERGRSLVGRVVNEYGQPVEGLELLVHTADAGIAHVSPSQRRLRAQRSLLARGSSSYQQCRARSDAQGVVEFTGLPSGELKVLPLDPGWTIEEPEIVEANGAYVVWTAARRLGVRLTVVERGTGQPVELARATFRADLTLADGEVQEWGQWVGRGTGGASFVLAPELLPGLEERTITRAAFYGTARVGDGEKTHWIAEPIVDLNGATGVVEVRVEVDLEAPTEPLAEGEQPEPEPPTGRLELDVRYGDAAPFEGQLVVRWVSVGNPSRKGKASIEPLGVGRFAAELPAEALSITVKDRFSSGSLPYWTGNVRCTPSETTKVFATLQRGATVTLTRPDGWKGAWSVHASWRPFDEDEWRGSWGYGTDESTLTLSALRPAEWRFRLSQDSRQDEEPLVRTVLVEAGESVVIRE